MLEERCERCAAIDASPRALHAILPSIHVAIARGVTIYVEACESIRIEGAHVAVAADVGEQVPEQRRSQQLNVVVDGRESLTALLDTGMTEVYRGMWTNSRYLSCPMHSGRLAEHTLARLRNAAAAESSGDGLRSILASHPFPLHSDVPGRSEMPARYAGTSKQKHST